MEGAAAPLVGQTCSSRTMRLLTLVWLATAAAAEDQCDGPLLQLQLQGKDAPPRTLYGVLATFGGIPGLANYSDPQPLVVASPLDACGLKQQQRSQAGAVYLVERGNCSFVDKYQAVLAAGGSGMVLFDDIPGCISMGGAGGSNSSNSSSSSTGEGQHRNASAPPAISIPRSDGTALVTELLGGAELTVQWQLMDVPALDASALLLWLMAVATVVVGSLWCGSDYAAELKSWGVGLGSPEDGRQQHGSGHGSGHGGGGEGMEILDITMKGAVGFVVVSSAMLLLLYFALSKVFFYFILVGFVVAGAQALGVMLLPLLCKALPALACRSVSLPWGWGEVGVLELILAPVALATAFVWAAFRNAPWSWVLQDLLGIAIMLMVLRTLRLPNLRVACVLLPLCFVYDIFWVFLQPLLTGGGTSVMVEVASGGDSHEFLPMLLRVPRLSGPPIIRGAYSLLGFGDVILPGLLVALMRRVDIWLASSASSASSAGSVVVEKASSRGCSPCRHGGYFVPAVMGYGGGLLLTYVALMFSWFGDQGQPALLYLVPSTLGVVLVLALLRGELSLLLDVGLDPQDDAVEVDATDASNGGSSGDGSRGGGGVGGAEPAEQRVALLAGQRGPRSSSSGSQLLG